MVGGHSGGGFIWRTSADCHSTFNVSQLSISHSLDRHSSHSLIVNRHSSAGIIISINGSTIASSARIAHRQSDCIIITISKHLINHASSANSINGSITPFDNMINASSTAACSASSRFNKAWRRFLILRLSSKSDAFWMQFIQTLHHNDDEHIRRRTSHFTEMDIYFTWTLTWQSVQHWQWQLGFSWGWMDDLGDCYLGVIWHWELGWIFMDGHDLDWDLEWDWEASCTYLTLDQTLETDDDLWLSRWWSIRNMDSFIGNLHVYCTLHLGLWEWWYMNTSRFKLFFYLELFSLLAGFPMLNYDFIKWGRLSKQLVTALPSLSPCCRSWVTRE